MDDLEHLLSPEATRPPPNVWPATTRVLRRRRWVRRGGKLAGATSLLIIGFFFARWTTPPVAPPALSNDPPRIVVDEPRRTEPPSLPNYDGESPARIERMAGIAAAADRRATLYRVAGDRYLERGDDVAALRCYRRALAGADAAELEIEPQRDSWMMMTLKMAKQREITDARP